MGHEDIIRSYHNHQEPDFDPETGVVLSPGSEAFKRYQLFKELESGNNESGIEAVKKIESVLSLIKEVRIDPAFRNNPEQISLLEKNKGNAKNKIRDVLSNIEEYIASIRALDDVKQSKESYTTEEAFIEKKQDADSFRTLKHDVLIKNLHATIRFIAHTFGDISEKAIEKWEEDLDERGIPLLFVERKKFPNKIICPDSLNLNDRKQITTWAYQIYYSLSQLKKELSD